METLPLGDGRRWRPWHLVRVGDGGPGTWWGQEMETQPLGEDRRWRPWHLVRAGDGDPATW